MPYEGRACRRKSDPKHVATGKISPADGTKIDITFMFDGPFNLNEWEFGVQCSDGRFHPSYHPPRSSSDPKQDLRRNRLFGLKAEPLTLASKESPRLAHVHREVSSPELGGVRLVHDPIQRLAIARLINAKMPTRIAIATSKPRISKGPSFGAIHFPAAFLLPK